MVEEGLWRAKHKEELFYTLYQALKNSWFEEILSNTAWELQQVHQLYIIQVKAMMRTVDAYYGHFSRILDLFLSVRPYGVPLVATFVGDTSERIETQLKVDGYRITNGAHGIYKKVQ